MTTALIYIRQSRHKDYERTASPEVQEQACRALPAVAVCDDVEMFVDLDVSGGGCKRRHRFLALRGRIESSPAGVPLVVAAYDQSRTFRNTADALDFFALVEKRPWIDVQFVHGRFDRSAAGEFTYTAMAAAHAMERRMTAEKIRDAYAYRNGRGEATGPPPFGYRRTSAGELVVDLETAPLVRQMFDDYATGAHTLRTLARQVNEAGHRNSRGNPWLPDTVGQTLGNIAYVGKTYAGGRRGRKGDVIPALWPALVTDDVFDAVQHQLRRNVRTRAGARRPQEPATYTFSRLLVCSCGRRLRVARGNGGTYYYCRRDLVTPCGARMAREDALLPWAETLFEALDGMRDADFRAALSRAEDRRQSPDAVAQVEGSLDRLRQLFTWGDITAEHYAGERERLGRLRDELLVATAPQPTIEVDGMLDGWRRGTAVERRLLLGVFFDALNVTDGHIVSYTPREDRVAEVIELIDVAFGHYAAQVVNGGFASPEREGFEPSNRVAPVTAFPVPRPRPD